MTINGLIFDIRRFSIHDGPGIRTTVFVKGCPLNCLWCHNPESQKPAFERVVRSERCDDCGACIDACPNKAISRLNYELITDDTLCKFCGKCVEACFSEAREIIGKSESIQNLMLTVEKDRLFYDQSGGGVTISGGEPLMQPQFVGELLGACKRVDIQTALDTSGYASWDMFDSLRKNVDLFLYDLKLFSDIQHEGYTGVSNRLIHENLNRLSQEGHRIIIRIPVVPGITDTWDNLDKLGELIANLGRVERVDLLPYHNAGAAKYERTGKIYPLSDLATPKEIKMAEIANRLIHFGLKVQIGG